MSKYIGVLPLDRRKAVSNPILRVTVTYEYEANPEHYPDGATPDEMAAVDAESPYDVALLAAEMGTVKVEAVKEAGRG